jgi:hypothetical protein
MTPLPGRAVNVWTNVLRPTETMVRAELERVRDAAPPMAHLRRAQADPRRQVIELSRPLPAAVIAEQYAEGVMNHLRVDSGIREGGVEPREARRAGRSALERL